MLKILDKDFVEVATLDLLLAGDVTKTDSGSWTINLRTIHDILTKEFLILGNYLSLDNQKFTIRKSNLVRSGEDKICEVVAEHVFHEIEEHAVPVDYQMTGTIRQHIEKLLSYQNGSDFVYSASGLSDPMYSIIRTVSISKGSIAQNLKHILDHFFARLEFNNYEIKPIPRMYAIDLGVVMEYGIQNESVRRSASRDDMVTKIICNATIDDAEVAKTYLANNLSDYRNPITRYVDFGSLNSQSDMDWLANEYLLLFSVPEVLYELSFAELKRISDIDVLYPDRNFEVDTGYKVTVLDTNLGIDIAMPILTYSYSLVSPEVLSRLTLGTLRQMRLLEEKKADALSVESDVLKWTETVMSYVHSIIGGTIREVDPGLLIYVGTNPANGKKDLNGVASRLKTITPDYDGPKWNRKFEIEDPTAKVYKLQFPTITRASSIIKSYIRDTAGSTSVQKIVSRINEAYAHTYGIGQVVSFADDTISSVFGDAWGVGTDEYNAATSIIQFLNSTIGNVSEIYLEIGGGEGGAIRSVNRLYEMLSGHGIKISSSAPDDSVGKDGDLWFKYDDDGGDSE